MEAFNYFSSNESDDYVILGYNFRMSDITAALGIAQLKKIDRIIEMRRKNAGSMSGKLSEISEIELPHSPEGFFHVYQMYTVKIRDGQQKRDGLSTYLADKGIMTKVYFPAAHLTHHYSNGLGYNCKLPVTEKITQQVLTLPMYPGLNENEIEYIRDSIVAFFSQSEE